MNYTENTIEAVRIVSIVAVQPLTEEFPRKRKAIERILSSFQKDNKTALRPDSRIRKGLGKETETVF